MTSGPMKWGPRFSVLGMLGGVLAGFGLLVLLQQAGTVYPTVTVAIAMLVGGLAFGIALPSLGVLLAVRRANNRRSTASPPPAERSQPQQQLPA